MKTYLTLFLILFAMIGFCQDEDLLKSMANQTCECITSNESDLSTPSKMEVALGLCMLEVIQENNYEIDITNELEMSEFGQKIGVQMALFCPKVFETFLEDEFEESNNQYFIEGKVKSVEKGTFVSLQIEENSGKLTKVIWLRYFRGSDGFLTKPEKLKGKSVRIGYQFTECYLPDRGEYVPLKEIVELTIQ